MNWFLPPCKARVFLGERSDVSTWPFLVGSFLVNWVLSVWPWPFQHQGCPPSSAWPGWQTLAACQCIRLDAISLSCRNSSVCANSRNVTEGSLMWILVSFEGCRNVCRSVLFRLSVQSDEEQFRCYALLTYKYYCTVKAHTAPFLHYAEWDMCKVSAATKFPGLSPSGISGQ